MDQVVISENTESEALSSMLRAIALGARFATNPTQVGHKWLVASIPRIELDEVRTVRIGMQVIMRGSEQAVAFKYRQALSQGATSINAPAKQEAEYVAIVDTATQTDFIW